MLYIVLIFIIDLTLFKYIYFHLPCQVVLYIPYKFPMILTELILYDIVK